MQDKDKILEIRNLLNSISAANDLYSDESKGFYFAYETVIELLQQVNETIDESARCPRPDNIPDDIPWCENMNNEFDTFVYRGDMSVEDFRRAQDNYFRDSQNDKPEDEDEGYEV
jgi:hypothetical protein